MVDHRIAPKGDMTLFWDRSNWQPFNVGCNSRKAIKSEGGFGRPLPDASGQSTGGYAQTLPKGPVTAWGPPRDISPNSDRGGNSR